MQVTFVPPHHDKSQKESRKPPSSIIDWLYHHPLRKPVKKVVKRIINYGVIITSIIGVWFLLFPPVPSLNGNTVVTLGGSLHIHGRGFIPFSDVFLTRESGGVLSSAEPDAALGSLGMQDTLTGYGSEMVAVDSSGSFNVTAFINDEWSPGYHTIHALEVSTGRTIAFSLRVTWPCNDFLCR